ncbi:DEAD/DEAH box helicase [Halobacterium litoreum]|uniref:DEAD/DEAH box helicase n=1 Tax=Halobacterium litoreum TaxID=2039234 RepID=A0ABD5NAZ7_9EURY|nr:DEAD/DEAH box helicase [Halobacterium litoreum]UHH12002.1 DEAD/DEAH box helicase [Halobacterium litoreum]
MDDLADWLRGRHHYDDQIADERTRPGREGETRDVALESRLESALADRGIDSLFAHQADAVEAVRDGDDVVVATPTASGKSLTYTVPAFERAMDHGGRTLYVAPQNALVADQQDTLSELARDLGFGSRVHVDTYTGRLSKSEKRGVRDRQPTVLLTNPDMLHYALLPHAHRLWEWFFSGLETVVLDEVHEYRGVFGGHVSLLLRRLRRVCERWDADPQFVCCSATIGNPVEHASRVTGRPEDGFALVDDDRSATGDTHWALWNPPEQGGGEGRRRSSHVETRHLMADLVADDHQTLAFTRSRQGAERNATETADYLRERGNADLADSIAAYQASLTDDRRRDLEADLHDGDARGVWSTSALELGVDVGGLDAVLLDGYPGTRMNTFQRAGRAGRGTDDAAVVLVAGEDQLDQYVMDHPEELFDGDPERAIVDPANEHLLDDHLRCAASENWLNPDDDAYFPRFDERVEALEDRGLLERRDTDYGTRWVDGGDGSPQHEMSLRTIDDREVRLLDSSNDTLATLELDDALRDAHPGAIYHHQGQRYEVSDLDVDRLTARLQPTWADYYTRVLTDKTIDVEADHEERWPFAGDVPVRFADITLTTAVTGYQRRDAERGETMDTLSLDLPEQTLDTRALYYTVPPDVETELREAGDLPGAIHAAEHAMISMFPTEFLCDRGDIGGLSTPVHPHTGRPTIFIYDGYPGGVGLVREGFDAIGSLAETTLSMLRSCDCEAGCPACVQSPQCGNANDPLDKGLAITLLAALTGD